MTPLEFLNSQLKKQKVFRRVNFQVDWPDESKGGKIPYPFAVMLRTREQINDRYAGGSSEKVGQEGNTITYLLPESETQIEGHFFYKKAKEFGLYSDGIREFFTQRVGHSVEDVVDLKYGSKKWETAQFFLDGYDLVTDHSFRKGERRLQVNMRMIYRKAVVRTMLVMRDIVLRESISEREQI